MFVGGGGGGGGGGRLWEYQGTVTRSIPGIYIFDLGRCFYFLSIPLSDALKICN